LDHEELVDRYYQNPQDYFHTNENNDGDIVDDNGNDNDSDVNKKNSLGKSAPQTLHPQDSEIASESQSLISDVENNLKQSEESKKLHDDKISCNLVFLRF
jgi:hypothetical protein